jgi:DMSO/TMAO reductase YedYZ molybdopterin-dependent catalytic subunit
VTRRELLLAAAGTSFVSAAQTPEPQNHAFPLGEVQGVITPNEFFFVRNHFQEPDVSLEDWQLSIEGLVKKPSILSFSDLLEQSTKKVEAVLECSGNAPNGSAVSNGIWEGVPLSFLLQDAQLDAEAAYLLLEGADRGTLSSGLPEQPYSQLVPIAKCLEATSLVAFKLNGAFLRKGNGFPARALLPGWYAMDSVKWLRRIVVMSAPDPQSSFYRSGMNKLYNRVAGSAAAPEVTRLTTVQTKSVIVWPRNAVKLPLGTYSVWGFAWSGGREIRSVELSFDGGKTWNTASVETRRSPLSWVRWNYSWKAVPGDFTMLSRAVDQSGNVQPLKRESTRRDGYELNWCEPVHCAVR